jgi:hypothetical protein
VAAIFFFFWFAVAAYLFLCRVFVCSFRRFVTYDPKVKVHGNWCQSGGEAFPIAASSHVGSLGLTLSGSLSVPSESPLLGGLKDHFCSQCAPDLLNGAPSSVSRRAKKVACSPSHLTPSQVPVESRLHDSESGNRSLMIRLDFSKDSFDVVGH